MLRSKTLLIAAVLAAFMGVCFVNSSDAVKYRIVEFPSDTEDYSYDGYVYHTASLKTSEPYLWVEWWVDNKRIKYSWGDGVTKEAYFWPETPGTIKGKKYKIEAFAIFTDIEDVEWDLVPWNWDYLGMLWRFMDFDSYTVRMFEPKVISGTKYPRGMPKHKLGKGIRGRVELKRHYHDGSNIVVDASVSAWNRTKSPVDAASWFRHTRFSVDDGRTLWTIEDTRPSRQLPSDDTYYQPGSSMISYPVRGDIKKGERIRLNAHIHLAVGGQVWHEEDNAWTHTFTEKDNESYEGD